MSIEAGGMSSRHARGGPKPPRLHPRNQKIQEAVRLAKIKEGDLLFRGSRAMRATADQKKGKVNVQSWNKPDDLTMTLGVSELRRATSEERTAFGLIGG